MKTFHITHSFLESTYMKIMLFVAFTSMLTKKIYAQPKNMRIILFSGRS